MKITNATMCHFQKRIDLNLIDPILMVKEFKQKKWSEYKYYRIEDDGVFVIYLPFDYNKDTEHTDKFIEEIFQARRNYLRTKFMKIDQVTPFETVKANFQWLYQEELISEDELLELQNKLDERRIIKGE